MFGRGLDVVSEDLPNSDISQKHLPRNQLYNGFTGKLNESHDHNHWPSQFSIDKGFNTLNEPKKSNLNFDNVQIYNPYQEPKIEEEKSDIQKLSFQLG